MPFGSFLAMTPNTAFAPGFPLSARRNPFRQPSRCTAAQERLAPRRAAVRAVVQVEPGSHRTIDAVSDSRYISPDGLSFRERAERLVADGALPSVITDTLVTWFDSYRLAVVKNENFTADAGEYSETMFSTLLELTRRFVIDPIQYESFHQMVRAPFDYYKFGFDFASVLLNVKASSVLGRESLTEAVNYAEQGHNVIFISNHQSEGDPYAIDFLLDWIAGCRREFCEQLIFMAGDRVRNDPVVSPFSAGRNLLTVYSKKHVNDVPELRHEKLKHNRRTIHATSALFKEGGKVLWFAPSGGRDRRSKETFRVEISDFDDGAVEMMRFTAEKAGVPCHFYPMSLWTYDMLPPPNSVGGAEIGEERIVNHIPMHMYIGKELSWDLPPSVTEKLECRKARCDIAQNAVIEGYKAIGGYDY